jgi:diguanylate cyclase
MPSLDALDILKTPVWLVDPRQYELVFANATARRLTGTAQLEHLRNGPYSAHAQRNLAAYLPALAGDEQIVEIWTIEQDGRPAPLSCRLSLAHREGRQLIVFEGLYASETAAPGAPHTLGRLCTRDYCRDERGFYERLFRTNTAPMLLIDPHQDGRIVDANLAATQFYGYSREQLCARHTWEINAMGRDVMPVMHEVAKLPGGHKPLNFVHRLADGSTRHVQTYAGPLELDGARLMLCIIHDITEQKRLEQELEQAALRDPLTGLGNRRQFLHLVDRALARTHRYGQDFSLMLIDADNFKLINDSHGHDVGDEVLKLLARTLEVRARKSDAVCRWGGEEFVIFLPHTDLDGALQLAEAVRSTVEQLSRPDLPQLTVSIGVAQYCADEDAASLFKRMDEALYRAKAGGRNRVEAS